MQLFDRLVEAWPERTIVPSLAERWEISDDGLRYVFHLREGLTWSDGTPLTAHDVEFGIKRVPRPREPWLVGGDLLRARARRGDVPRHEHATAGRHRCARARRPDGRVPARRAGAVLDERHEPPRRAPQPRHAVEAGAGRSARRERRRSKSPNGRTSGSFSAGRAARSGNVAEVALLTSDRRRRAIRVTARRVSTWSSSLHPAPRRSDARRGSMPTSASELRVVGIHRLRPHRPCLRQRRLSSRARARDRPRGARRRRFGQHRRGRRWSRPARAPGPHARHRAALRPRPRPGVPRSIRLRGDLELSGLRTGTTSCA